MVALRRPRVLSTEQNTQYSYDVPHRVNTVVTYPIPSQNGSRVIIYGTDNGIRIIWRGGRPFKPSAPPAPAAPKAKDVSNDAVMILDSDDDDAQSDAPEIIPAAEFEDEEEEFDRDAPFPPIIQYLDLTFGTSVTQIATHGLLASDVSSTGSLKILQDKIIFAAACADNLVRVVTLPLTPPSPDSKARKELRSSVTASYAGSGKWNETVTSLIGHSMPVDKVSLSFSAVDNTADRDESGKSQGASATWYVLVASHSRAVNGHLLLHKLPIQSKSQKSSSALSISTSATMPFQTQYLTSPAVCIAFNNFVFSKQFSTRLLLADESGACKIYDCQTVGDVDESGAAEPKHGVWLLTLFASFQNSRVNTNIIENLSLSNHGRKSFVDAQWVLGGRAIIVLLADGDWGIWDIEGVRLNSTKSSLIQTGLKGGAAAKFSVSGWIDGMPSKSASQRLNGHSAQAKFAPMTPGTRKIVETSLFTGRTAHGSSRGQISVLRLPGTTRGSEESVLIWLEEAYAIIPNIGAFCDRSRIKSGGSLFSAAPGSRIINLESINLYGEKCCGIAQAPRRRTEKSDLPTEMLILGERRFLMVTDGPQQEEFARATAVPTIMPASQAMIHISDDFGLGDIDMQLDLMDTDASVRPKKALRFA